MEQLTEHLTEDLMEQLREQTTTRIFTTERIKWTELDMEIYSNISKYKEFV